jgi:XTP/dITP diphosphohydrolase
MKTIPDRILIATRNRGKVNEIRDLVAGLPVEFLSLDDLPDAPDVVEDRDTFEENALKKARDVANATGLTAIADDSGLCVDALGGGPGVLSARYGGEGATDEKKCLRILEELRDVPDTKRTARFVCALALVEPDGVEHLFVESCEGRIIRELRGSRGFGYDPIFLYEPLGLTFAEMDREAKNQVSHRGRALRRFAGYLVEIAATTPSCDLDRSTV